MRLRYHALRPHTALAPCPVKPEAVSAQQESEVAWCLLLVTQILSVLLPPEDLQNPCLEVLVSEILAELVFHNGICGKACEPWLLWESVAKILRAQNPVAVPTTRKAAFSSDALHQRGMADAEAAPGSGRYHSLLRLRPAAITYAFWALLQGIMTICFLLQSVAIALMHAAKIPPRRPTTAQTLGKSTAAKSHPGQPASNAQALGSKDTPRPIVSMYIWPCVSSLLMLEQRMPWLSGMLSLCLWMVLHGPGQICRVNSRLDR